MTKVTLRDLVREYKQASSPGQSAAEIEASVDSFMGGVDEMARMHAKGCTAQMVFGMCVAGCENDEALRKRLKEQFG